MATKKVILVESPAKARTIQKFVSADTKVMATYGHIRDLPKSNLGVEIENNFEPKYVIPRKASAVVKELKSIVKGANDVYLATDPDREGEAIAWHLIEALDLNKSNTRRILFHEITKQAIEHALNNPEKINDDLVNAQQARRVLDRLVGYSLSPLLWRKLYRGLSAGRVQSVALRLIVDREAEILAFNPQEYWSLWATFQTAKQELFLAKLEKIDQKSLDKYPDQSLIKNAQRFGPEDSWMVINVKTEQKQRHPKPPFTTSTLQQEASRKLRFSVKQTMMFAQKLYEGITLDGETVGLITYMRTDSFNLAETAINEAREMIKQLYGSDFLPTVARKYKTKSKGAQEAHEAIRPTSFARKPEDISKYLSAEENKLYKLIWDRAIACQMASADIEATQIQIGLSKQPEAITYVSRGFRTVFAGYLKVYEEGSDEGEEANEDEQTLPKLNPQDRVDMKDREAKQHYTEPLPRFTEASLVKELERLGIGRPSTYAPTIATLVDRGYAKKEDNKFIPQEVGRIVTDLLKDKFPTIVNYQFTADMEEKFDNVAEGKIEWKNVIREFYTPFNELVQVADKDIEKKVLAEEKTDEVCPTCGKALVIKLGRFGKFYACTGFPECRYTRPIQDDSTQQANQKIIENRKCPLDSAELVVKTGRFGSFVGCSNYPNCRFIEAINKETGILCPLDKGAIIERRSRKGKLFWGCSNYPKCTFASWNKPIETPCPQCHGLMAERKDEIACTKCDYKSKKITSDS